MPKTTNKLAIFLLAVVVVIAVVFFSIAQKDIETSSFTGSHTVALAINPEDTSQTQVLLEVGGDSRVFGVIDNVYTHHYHPAEFVDGSLYVIRRIGDIQTDDWTDQLWKYQTQDDGEILYEGQGVDFRVAPDGHSIAVFAGASPDEVVILDPNGDAVQVLLTKEFLDLNSDYSLSYLTMTNKGLWLSETQATQRMNVIGYDFDSGEIRRWDISDTPVGIHESDFNPESLLIVYSDYQYAFDQETEQELTDTPVALYLFNLADGSKRLLVTSAKRHEFDPKWIDEAEIEFNALDGSGRDQISFQ